MRGRSAISWAASCILLMLCAALSPTVSSGAGSTELDELPRWAVPAPDRTSIATRAASGIVRAVDRARGTLLLDQGFVDGMGWPMQIAVWYAVEDGKMIESVVVGTRVR